MDEIETWCPASDGLAHQVVRYRTRAAPDSQLACRYSTHDRSMMDGRIRITPFVVCELVSPGQKVVMQVCLRPVPPVSGLLVGNGVFSDFKKQ